MNELIAENSMLKLQMNELMNRLERFESSQELILENLLKLQKGFFTVKF